MSSGTTHIGPASNGGSRLVASLDVDGTLLLFPDIVGRGRDAPDYQALCDGLGELLDYVMRHAC